MRAHLDACEACRAEYANLQRVLNIVDAAPVPERAANYGTQVWRRLEPELGGRCWWTRWLAPIRWPVRHWAAVAGDSRLGSGRVSCRTLLPEGPHPSQMASAGQVRERILLVAVGDHLERSQMVLVEAGERAARAGPGYFFGAGARRGSGGRQPLVPANGGAARRHQRGRSIGRTGAGLIEIANGPAHLTPEEVEKLRQRIEGDGILFKVRVVGSTVRHREEKAAANPGQKSL